MRLSGLKKHTDVKYPALWWLPVLDQVELLKLTANFAGAALGSSGVSPHAVTRAEGLQIRGSCERPEGPYLGAGLSPLPPQAAAWMMSKNTDATFEAPPQLKAPEVA